MNNAAHYPRHLVDPDGVAGEMIEYTHLGVTLEGCLFAAQDSAPGVLVAHEAPGINEHIKARAQALATAGYTAFALDMYGAQGFAFEEAIARHNELVSSPGLMRGRAEAAMELLMSHPKTDRSRIAAMGFCQGGMTALELARGGAPLRSVVGFHPGLSRPSGSLDGEIKAQVLMMVGDADPMIPPEDRQQFIEEMRTKDAAWSLHIFGGVGHTFTNPAADALNQEGFSYSSVADRRSWLMAMSFLEETLRGREHSIQQ